MRVLRVFFGVLVVLLSVSGVFANVEIAVNGELLINNFSEYGTLGEIKLTLTETNSDPVKDGYDLTLVADHGTFGTDGSSVLPVSVKKLSTLKPIQYNYLSAIGMDMIHVFTNKEMVITSDEPEETGWTTKTVPADTEICELCIFDMDEVNNENYADTEVIFFATNYSALEAAKASLVKMSASKSSLVMSTELADISSSKTKVNLPDPVLYKDSLNKLLGKISAEDSKVTPALSSVSSKISAMATENITASSGNVKSAAKSSDIAAFRNALSNAIPAEITGSVSRAVSLDSVEENKFYRSESTKQMPAPSDFPGTAGNSKAYTPVSALAVGDGFDSREKFDDILFNKVLIKDDLKQVEDSSIALFSAKSISSIAETSVTTSSYLASYYNSSKPHIYPGYSIDEDAMFNMIVPQDCADISGDHIVNLEDMALLAANWLTTGDGLQGDFDEDQTVDSGDLGELTNWWLDDPGCGYYYASALPYQTSFEPMQGYSLSNLSDDPNLDRFVLLNGQNGWEVEEGIVGLVYHDYVYSADDPNHMLEGRQNAIYIPGGSCSKRFVDTGTDNKYVQFEIYPGINSEVNVSQVGDIVAGVKFNYTEATDPNDPNTADYSVHFWDGELEEYYNTGIDYRLFYRLVGHSPYNSQLESPVRMRFFFDMRWEDGVYDVYIGADGAPGQLLDEYVPMCWNIPLGGTSLDKITINAEYFYDELLDINWGWLYFDRLYIGDYLFLVNSDPDDPYNYNYTLENCAFDMVSPCQCDTMEDGLSEALTPVIGTFMGYSTSGYNITCCPVEHGRMEWFEEGNSEDLLDSFVNNNWYVSDIRHSLRANEEDNLGWFRTGLIPNGNYYLSVMIFSDITNENGYAVPWDILWLDYRQQTISGQVLDSQPASTITVATGQKGQAYKTSYSSTIKVPWAGDTTGLPFELTHYYSSANCLKKKPFYNGWTCSYEYTIVEDTRFFFEYNYNVATGDKVPFCDHGNYGVGFGFATVKTPDGSGMVFRRADDAGNETDGKAIYYPYPDNGSDDKLIRESFIITQYGGYYLTKLAYTLIRGDGSVYYFDDNISNVELSNSGVGTVGWYSESKIRYIKDRFDNTVNIDYTSDPVGDQRIDSVYIGSGSNEKRIKFYDGGQFNPSDGLIDRAELIVGGDYDNPWRTVRYSVENSDLHSFFSYYYKLFNSVNARVLTSFTIADDNIYSDTSSTNYIAGSGGAKYGKYTYHPEMTGYLIANGSYNDYAPSIDDEDIFYDEWGNVREIYRPIDKVVEDGYTFVKAPADIFTYEYYSPVSDDIYQVDPNSDGNWLKSTCQHAAGYLLMSDYKDYANGYKEINVIDDKGCIMGGRKEDYLGNRLYDSYYQYGDMINITKPTRIDEYFDDKHRITEMNYDSRGNMLSKSVYDADDQAECKNEVYTWHEYYNFPESQTTWQANGDDSTTVRSVNIYGLADGTISATAEDNKYLVQQKTLLSCDSDPNQGDYATTYFTYRSDGLPLTVTDPVGNVQEIEYDDNGYKHYVSVGDSLNYTERIGRYEYDVIGQLLTDVDSMGKVTEHCYDWHGRECVTAVLQDISLLTANLEDPNYERVYTDEVAVYYKNYDNKDRLIYEENPDYDGDGHWGYTKTSYNRAGNLAEKYYMIWFGQSIEGIGFVSHIVQWKEEFIYNYRGLLENHCRGTADPIFGDLLDHYEEKVGYDDFDREMWRLWTNYCEAGAVFERVRLVETDYFDSGKKKAEYVFSRDADYPEQRTSYDYDIFGRMTSRTADPVGVPDPNVVYFLDQTTSYQYDNCDNQIATIDPKGDVIETAYDNANRSVGQYFAHAQGSSRVLRSQTQYYDNNKVRRKTSFDRDGSTILKDTEYAYDIRGRITDVYEDKDGLDVCHTGIFYNDFMDPNHPEAVNSEFVAQPYCTVKIVDGENKSTWRKYDVLGNLTKIHYPSGLMQKMSYFEDGKLDQKAYFNPDGTVSWIDYIRNDLGWLIGKVYPDDTAVGYQYDLLGRVEAFQKLGTSYLDDDNNEVRDVLAEQWFGYDAMDKIVSCGDDSGLVYSNIRQGDGQIVWQHIALDEENDPNGCYVTEFGYDRAGRLTTSFCGGTMDDWYLNVAYDDNGNLETLDYMSGFGLSGDITATYGYNADNQLNSIASGYYDLANVTLDGMGRLKTGSESIYSNSGTTIANSLSYSYDRRGSLTSASIGSWNGGYSYKLDGNMDNRTENGLSEPFEYDFDNDGTDESNMLSEIAGNPISWDKNGWLTSDGMHTFSYDYEGKMQLAVSIADPNNMVEYKYDPMGNRIGRIEYDVYGVASERKYVLDYTGSVPKVLLELDKVAGQWVVSQKNYYYGNRLVMSTDGNDLNRRYYIHDRLGSVRCVVDGNALTVQNNYTYTPYGEDINSQTTETVVNNVRYAGYNYDDDLGKYYVWARMYSPYMARFNGYDPVLGEYNEPLTLHQFLYCWNDPINHTDPSGEFLDTIQAEAQWVSMASEMYDKGQSALGYARMVANGASLNSVLLSAAIDVGMDVAGGKVFEAFASVGSKYMKKILNRNRPIASLGKGSTGRTIPNDLKEQLAMEQVLSDPEAGKWLSGVPVDDLRNGWLSDDGWLKYAQNVEGNEIHYLYNWITDTFDDFKFK